MRLPALLSLLCLLTALVHAGPARRVVSLAPHTTELVLAAGGQERLVAAVPADAPLPSGVLRLSAIGGLDRERLLALRPDLVVAWTSGNRPADLAWLRRQGIPVYASEPRDLARIAEDIRALGRLMGTRARAEQAARRFLATLARGCARAPAREVYVDIWDHPAMSLGGRHWLNDALTRAGLRNTFAQVDRGVFSVEREALMARGALPRLQLRDGVPLGARALGRPGPAVAGAVQQLCRQRRSLHPAPAGETGRY